MIVPLSMMILTQAAQPEQRGRVMGIVAVSGQVALIAGPMIGGLLVGAVGWRWIFYVNVPFAWPRSCWPGVDSLPARHAGRAEAGWTRSAWRCSPLPLP
ncbi:MFS transporter [Streptomyces sp. NPDC056308]|uniref:MFS transporter n=1 Tax=Streptomyces sp. NPDC056308 TaxID=3345780 RepID=UPI0035DA9E2F